MVHQIGILTIDVLNSSTITYDKALQSRHPYMEAVLLSLLANRFLLLNSFYRYSSEVFVLTN